MIGFGIAFVIVQVTDRSAFNGHLVLGIEVVELLCFVTFWALQTVERWNSVVSVRPPRSVSETSPSGGVTPPSGGVTPPSGGVTPPSGDGESPEVIAPSVA